MKKLLLSTALVAVMAFYGSEAPATTVTAPADIDIVKPIQIRQRAKMDFGTIAINTGTSGATAFSNGTPPINAQQLDLASVSNGIFHLLGTSGATYTFVVPASTTLTGPGTPLTAVLTGGSTGNVFAPAGNVEVVSGKISGLMDTQVAGAYAGTYPATDTYP